MTVAGRTIDLNADLGEGFPWDGALLARISSANISCGSHAGTPESIKATLASAARLGVVVGAHPGYPDRQGFGRREQSHPTSAIREMILEQLDHLADLASRTAAVIRYIKPHGALYNQAQRDPAVADGVVEALQATHLPLVGMPHTVLERLARSRDVPFIREGFADRRYSPAGRLVPRTQPGAILDDPVEIESQVLFFLDNRIDSICLHGDNPRSIELADLVRSILARHDITVRASLAS